MENKLTKLLLRNIINDYNNYDKNEALKAQALGKKIMIGIPEHYCIYCGKQDAVSNYEHEIIKQHLLNHIKELSKLLNIDINIKES